MLKIKIVRVAVILSILGATPSVFAQSKKVAVADSLHFAKLADRINGIVNRDPKAADSLAHIYFAEARKLNHDDYSGRGAALINSASLVQGDISKALTWYTVAQRYFKRSKNHLWTGYTNMNMGIALSGKYDFERGLPYILKSIKDFELARDNNMLASAYCTLSMSFHDFGNYEKGKQYAFLALETIKRSKDVKQFYQWQAYSALAINYDDNKEWDKAIKTHLEALKFANRTYIPYTYNNLGNTYKKKGQLNNALKYLNLSLSGSRASGNGYHLASVYGNIADVYRLQHNYQPAGKYIDSTLYYSRQSKSPEKLIDAYDFAYQLKNDTGDYKSAVTYLNLRTALKDSLLNADKAKIIYNYQEQYETKEKEKRIQQQQFEIAKRNYWLIMALAAFVLFCIGAYVLYRLYKNKQEKKLQEEILRQQEIEARALFEGEQSERIRIARDLHDGVGQMLSLVKMNLSAIDTKDAVTINTMDLLDKTIDEVRNVSHNLIPEELNFGIFRALENIADKVNSSGDTKMSIHISQELQSLTFEKQNELSIYRIVQEVVNNMIKHAGANRIDLSITRVNKSIIIALKDNGRGLAEDAIGSSKGIGWKNINARVHLLDGKINIRSEKLTGTQIEITLPEHGQ